MIERVNQYKLAAKAWPLLTQCAATGASMTYGELAKAIGIHHRPLRYTLGILQDYCKDTDKPPLTILVVRGGDKKPGSGFIGWDQELNQPRAEVLSYPWASVPNPFAFAADGTTYSELVDRVIENPAEALDVYRLVKDRGQRQIIFRDILLIAYEGACAFCGLSFREALDAAHIHAWAVCSEKDKINPRNGILLCRNHHQMFDMDNLSIGEDLRIKYVDPERLDGPYSTMDEDMSVSIHGEKMRVPSDPRLRPDPMLIAARALDHSE